MVNAITTGVFLFIYEGLWCLILCLCVSMYGKCRYWYRAKAPCNWCYSRLWVAHCGCCWELNSGPLCRGSVWLALRQFDRSHSHLRGGILTWENVSQRSTVGKSVTFLLVMNGRGLSILRRGGYPWSGDPGFYEKAVWTSHEEHASNQDYLMASVSAPAFGFLPWFPSMMSSNMDV